MMEFEAFKSKFADHLEGFLELHRAYVQSLEDLVRHLQQIDPPKPQPRTSNKSLQKIVKKVGPSGELERWMTGKTEMQPALPHLPDRLADDLDVLRELASQMEIHVEAWDEIYHQAIQLHPAFQTARDDELGPGDSKPANAEEDTTLSLMAATLDSCVQETKLLDKVHASVALDANADLLASYCALLRLEPYMREPLLREILTWACH